MKRRKRNSEEYQRECRIAKQKEQEQALKALIQIALLTQYFKEQHAKEIKLEPKN